MTKSSNTTDQLARWELMKATKVAICEFLAGHPSAGIDPDSMMRQAKNIRSLEMTSKRQLLAMQSELGSTTRNLRRKVRLGYLSPDTYNRLVQTLRDQGLIDVSQWRDTDAARVQELIETGEIRTAAERRLATEYRDTIDDEHALETLDEMIAAYDSKRGMPTGASLRKPLSAGKEGSLASTDEIASSDLLKRTAIACLEYVYRHGFDRVRGNASILDQATSWRGFTVKTKRQLKEIERAFSVVVSDVRSSYLSAEEFSRLQTVLRENGLIDIGNRRRQ